MQFQHKMNNLKWLAVYKITNYIQNGQPHLNTELYHQTLADFFYNLLDTQSTYNKQYLVCVNIKFRNLIL